MGGHDAKHPDVPDWRIYRVEDVPELMKVKEKLEKRGLKYPWLRNEVWKYTKDPLENSFLQMFKFLFGGGLKYGAAAAVVTIIAEKAYMAYIEKSIEESGEGGHH